jgi:hypothetical protein
MLAMSINWVFIGVLNMIVSSPKEVISCTEALHISYFSSSTLTSFLCFPVFPLLPAIMSAILSPLVSASPSTLMSALVSALFG